MSVAPVTTIQVSDEIHTRLGMVKGAIQAGEGETVTFSEAVLIVTDEFLADRPEAFDTGRIRAFRNQPLTSSIKMHRSVRGDLLRVAGFIQFRTGVRVTFNAAIGVAIDHYLEDVPLPL